VKVLVCGSREFTDATMILEELERFPADTTILHGACSRGADSIADRLARDVLHLSVQSYPAQWHVYGKSAGRRRNWEMLCQKPDLVLAFLREGAGNRGTRNMVQIAAQAGVVVHEFVQRG